MQKIIFHIDMDAFYASVEQKDHPEYIGKPLIVGALPGNRGVVSTCSYEARKFGVRSGMPISQAYARCPKGIYVLPRMKRYQEVSALIMDLFKDYSPQIIQLSVDEAFLDMTGTEKLFGSPEKVAQQIKNKVKALTGLTLSVGIAANHLVAKMASDFDKPNGLTLVPPGKECDFLDQLPLKDLWGVGKKSQDRLAELGITSIKQIREFDIPTLVHLCGKSMGDYLYNIVRGIDPGMFDSGTKSHSISAERTFKQDTRDRLLIEKTLLEISHTIMFRLMEEKVRTRTIVLKVRYEDFSTTTIQKKNSSYLSSAEEIYTLAKELLKKKWNSTTPLRLLGVGTADLEKIAGPSQQELFETPGSRHRKLEEAILRIKSKYPQGKITKARLLDLSKDSKDFKEK